MNDKSKEEDEKEEDEEQVEGSKWVQAPACCLNVGVQRPSLRRSSVRILADCLREARNSDAAPSDEVHVQSPRPSIVLTTQPVAQTIDCAQQPADPPPSYSHVMKEKVEEKKQRIRNQDMYVSPRPPPSYGGMAGIYLNPETQLETLYTMQNYPQTTWRSHSQPALCHRCGILVLTTINAHDATITHVSVFLLCILGCWPCCLLPYCLKGCKNIDHHCPLCQAYLGTYSPW